MKTCRSKVKPALRTDLFLKLLQQKVSREAVAEYRFHPVRKWRFDYAIPSLKIAIEKDGGIWTGGRHVSPAGYIKDLEKLNTATSMGWRVLRFSSDDMFCVSTLKLIRSTVEAAQERRDEIPEES